MTEETDDFFFRCLYCSPLFRGSQCSLTNISASRLWPHSSCWKMKPMVQSCRTAAARAPAGQRRGRGPQQRAFPGCRFKAGQDGGRDLLWPDVSPDGHCVLVPLKVKNRARIPKSMGYLPFHNSQVGRLWTAVDEGKSLAKAVAARVPGAHLGLTWGHQQAQTHYSL